MRKYVSLIMAPLAMLAIVMTACADRKVNELKSEIEKFNKSCPIDLGSMGLLDSASYDSEANVFVIYTTVNDRYLGVGELTQERRKLCDENLKLAMFSPGSENFSRMLADIGAGVRAECRWKENHQPEVLTIPAEEIKRLVENPISDQERYKIILDNLITASNLSCPMEMEKGVTLVNVVDDGSNVIYNCNVDETIYCMATLEENQKQIKLSMELAFRNDPASVTLGTHIANAGRGLIYRYTGDYFGRSFDITFPIETLRAFRRPNLTYTPGI